MITITQCECSQIHYCGFLCSGRHNLNKWLNKCVCVCLCVLVFASDWDGKFGLIVEANWLINVAIIKIFSYANGENSKIAGLILMCMWSGVHSHTSICNGHVGRVTLSALSRSGFPQFSKSDYELLILKENTYLFCECGLWKLVNCSVDRVFYRIGDQSWDWLIQILGTVEENVINIKHSLQHKKS